MILSKFLTSNEYKKYYVTFRQTFSPYFYYFNLFTINNNQGKIRIKFSSVFTEKNKFYQPKLAKN